MTPSARWHRLCVVLVVVFVLLSGATSVDRVQASESGIESGTIDTFGSNAWPFNDMAQNSSGTVHQVNIDENDRITVRAWNGSAWSVVTSFTAAAVNDVTVDSLSNDLSLDIDSQDHLHLAYRGSIGSGTGNIRGVLYGEYDGSSWTHSWVENATHPNGWRNFDDPLLVVDGSDQPHLQYEFSGENTNDIRHATPDGTGGWTIQNLVSTDGSGTDEVFTGAIDVDSAGTVHAWFVREDSQNTYNGNVYYTSRPSGGSWSSPTKVIDSTGDGLDYHLGDAVVDSDDDIHLTYSYAEYDGGGSLVESEIYHQSDESGSMQDTLVARNTSRILTVVGLQHTTQGPYDVYVMADSVTEDYSQNHQEFHGRDANDGTWVDGTELTFASGLPYLSEMVFEVTPGGDLVAVTEDGNLRNVKYKAGPVTALFPVSNTPPTFDSGSPSLSIDEDSGASSIDSLLGVTDTEGGSTLTWSVASAPSNGTLGGFDATAGVGTSVTPNGLTYTPDTDFFGSDSFDVQVADGVGGTDTVTISVTVSGLGDVPTASDDSLTTNEDTAGTLTMAATDVDGDSLTYAVVAQPTDGTVTVDGTHLTYTPDVDFSGTNSFSYQVDDGTDGTDTGDVIVTVSAVNDRPVASATSLTTTEETSGDVEVSATDVDGDALTYGVASQPDNGSVSNSGTTFTYVPDTDFAGADEFTFEAADGNGGTDTATVSVTVTNINDAPTAPDESVSTAEDVDGILVNPASDVDGDSLTYSILAQPSNGSVSVAGDNLTYVPDSDFSGSDSFDYAVNDGNGASDSGTVSVSVSAVNDPPTTSDDSYTTDEDTTLTVTAPAGVLDNDADVDGDTLTASVVSGPSNGSLSLAADGSFDFAPDTDFSGSDAFSYEAADGNGGTAQATVSISVTGVNDIPTVTNDSYTTDEDTILSVDASAGVFDNDADVDGDTLTASVVSGPSNGSLSLAANGSFDYTPDADFAGSDAFTYEATDGSGGTAQATALLSITAVNDPPVATGESYLTDEEVTVTVTPSAGVLANDTDVEGDALVATVTSGPSNGTLTLSTDGSFDYTPDTDFFGSDEFTYEVADGNGGTDTATVTLTVTAVNDDPTAGDDGYTTDEDTPISIDTSAGVLANDTDVEGDSLTAAVASGASNGTLTLSTDGSFDYTPDANFTGTDSFTYEVADGDGGTAQATVTLTVDAVADAPTLSNLDGAMVDYAEDGAPVSLDAAPSATVTDPDSMRSMGTLVAAVTANGTDDEDVLALNTSGDVSLSAGLTAGSTVTVSGTTVGTVRSGERGADGEALGIDFTSGVADAQVETLIQALTYENTNTGAPDTRSRTVTLTLTDAGGSDTAVVTVTVTATNDVPVAMNDSYTMEEDTTLAVDQAEGLLANDTDADGESLVVNVTAGTEPTNGSLTLAPNGSFNYTPAADFAGSDSFSYEVADGTGTTARGSVTIIVTDVVEPRRGGSGQEAPSGRVLLSTSTQLNNGVGRAKFGAASDSVESVQVQFSERARGRWRASQLERPPAESNYAGDEENVVASLDLSVPANVQDRPATVTMTIRQSRVDAMGVTSDQLVVDHYDDATSMWSRLESRVVSTSGGYVTLEVQAPHFSLFVISAEMDDGLAAPAGTATVSDAATPRASATDSPVVAERPVATPTPAPVEALTARDSAEDTPSVGVGTVALILALSISGVGLWLRRRF